MAYKQKNLIALVVVAAVILGVKWFSSDAPAAPDGGRFATTTPRISATPRDTPRANPTPSTSSEELILIPGVPFTSQAPFGNWDDPRQQAGCEEASALMAMRWVQGRGLTLAEAEREILAISDYELSSYGEFHDTASRDLVNWVFKDYFKYDKVRIQYDIVKNDIVRELSAGNLVLVPTDGRILDNPYYTPPGPQQHMLVIRGYDPATREFITNDPGTKHGASFRYDEAVMMSSIYEYPTGNHEPVTRIRKVMIVVEPA